MQRFPILSNSLPIHHIHPDTMYSICLTKNSVNQSFNNVKSQKHIKVNSKHTAAATYLQPVIVSD